MKIYNTTDALKSLCLPELEKWINVEPKGEAEIPDNLVWRAKAHGFKIGNEPVKKEVKQTKKVEEVIKESKKKVK